MTLQPDDPGRRRPVSEAGVDEPFRSEEMTTEPPWVLPSIVLGVVALSGSVLLWVLVGLTGLILWIYTHPPEESEQKGDGYGYPTGGPFGTGIVPP